MNQEVKNHTENVKKSVIDMEEKVQDNVQRIIGIEQKWTRTITQLDSYIEENIKQAEERIQQNIRENTSGERIIIYGTEGSETEVTYYGDLKIHPVRFIKYTEERLTESREKN